VRHFDLRKCALLLACLLVLSACAANSSGIQPTASLPNVQSVTTPLAVIAGSTVASRVPSATPIAMTLKIERTGDISGSIQVSPVADMALGDGYVYWVSFAMHNRLYATSLTTGKTGLITQTNAAGAFITYLKVSVDGTWLRYMELTQGNSWILHAMRLRDFQDIVVYDMIHVQAGQEVSFLPDADVSDDQMVIARQTSGSNPKCNDSILEIVNLQTGTHRVLDRACSTTEHTWSTSNIVGNTILAGQDTPPAKGDSHSVFRINARTNSSTKISGDQTATMPELSNRYAVWKVGPRYDPALFVSAYNLQTGQIKTFDQPARGTADPHVDGKWLYWIPLSHQEFVVRDLDTDQLLTVATLRGTEIVRSVIVHNRMIAWVRDPDFPNLPQRAFIEWRMLPN